MVSAELNSDAGSIISPFDRPDGEVVRFGMSREIRTLPPEQPLPFGYRIEPWCEPMLPAYAAVLAVSFADSSDLMLFPKLASKEGCIQIMGEITRSIDFMSGGSWLVLFNKEPSALVLSSRKEGLNFGKISVVAVAPRHRRVGVGTLLANKALWAFRDHHLQEAQLVVNRSNRAAVRFFRSIDFHVKDSKEHG